MKKILSMVLILALMLTLTTTAFASSVTPVESKVGFVLDGKVQTWDEATLGKIFLSQGRSFVPLRVISEKLGYKVTWEQKTSTAVIEKGDVKISFKIGASEVSTPSGVVTLDVASFVMNGRTYVPMRGLFEALNAEIDWVSAKVTASNLGVSMNTLSKDFYVTVKSSGTGTTTTTPTVISDYITKDLDFVKEPWETLMDKHLPSDVFRRVDSTIMIGAQNSGNEDMRISTNGVEYLITVRKFQLDHVKVMVKEALVVFSNEADANEIYDNYLNRVWIGEYTKAKNGTQYKFSNEGGYGTTIHIKIK